VSIDFWRYLASLQPIRIIASFKDILIISHPCKESCLHTNSLALTFNLTLLFQLVKNIVDLFLVESGLFRQRSGINAFLAFACSGKTSGKILSASQIMSISRVLPVC